MIGIVKNVQERRGERVEVREDGETLDNVAEFFTACFSSELDFSGVECADTADLETGAN